MSLEGFQPHPNLRMLYLSYYKGSRLPGWLLSLTNLVRLELDGCKKCQYLLQLSQLPSLKCLRLNDIGAMQYISDYGDRNDFTSSIVPASFFPSLKELYLVNCPNLRGWWRWDSSVDVDNGGDKSPEITIVTSLTVHHSIPSFPCLSELFIKDCLMLTSMPIFSHLEKELYLFNASLKLLQQTMLTAFPLSNLKHLQLSSVMELEILSEEWLQNLISLSSLTIEHCHKLKSFLPGIRHLTALKDLKLCRCPELQLAEDEDGMQWQELKSLLSLEFQYLPRLVSLPTGLQHVVTLQRLKILNCEKLTAIPGWIQKLKTLEVLELVGCSGLTALPEGMRQLSSLHKLKIADNPCILQRCKRETGEDWPKIAHIPEEYLDVSQEGENSNTHTSSADSDSDAEAVESVEKERKGIIPRLFKNARSRS